MRDVAGAWLLACYTYTYLRSEKTKANLERVEEERAKQAEAAKQRKAKRNQLITGWLKKQEEEEEKQEDPAPRFAEEREAEEKGD